MRGVEPAVSRTVPVWQMAQFIPSLGMITFRGARPMGTSLPGSNTKPNDAYPFRGSGNFSGNIAGSTFQIQYGIPLAASLPIESYLKCAWMSVWAVGASGLNF